MEKVKKQIEEFKKQVKNPENPPQWFLSSGSTGPELLALIADGLYSTTENPYFLIEAIDKPEHRSAVLKSATIRQRQKYYLESRNRHYTALVVALEYLFNLGTPAAVDLAKSMDEPHRLPGFNGYFFQPIAGFNFIDISAPDGDWVSVPAELYQLVARKYKNLAEELRRSLRHDGIRNQALAYILAVRANISNMETYPHKKKSAGISAVDYTSPIMHYFMKSPWPPVLIRQANREDKKAMHPVFYAAIEMIVDNPPWHGSGDLAGVYGGLAYLILQRQLFKIRLLKSFQV